MGGGAGSCRPLAEIARSRHRMRFGTDAAPVEAGSTIVPLLAKHSASSGELLGRAKSIGVLEVDYPSPVTDPAPWIEHLAAFPGPALFPTPAALATAIRPRLHRQRKK